MPYYTCEQVEAMIEDAGREFLEAGSSALAHHIERLSAISGPARDFPSNTIVAGRRNVQAILESLCSPGASFLQALAQRLESLSVRCEASPDHLGPGFSAVELEAIGGNAAVLTGLQYALHDLTLCVRRASTATAEQHAEFVPSIAADLREEQVATLIIQARRVVEESRGAQLSDAALQALASAVAPLLPAQRE